VKRLLIFARGVDSAGTGAALKLAFDQCGAQYGWEARMVRRKNSWLDYPGDITWPYKDPAMGRVVMDLYRQADVIYAMQVPAIITGFTGWESKVNIVSQIGTYFRNDPEGVSAAVQAIGAHEVVNSLELLNLAPKADLLMWTVDLDMLARLREQHRRPDDGRIRIYHSPTNRAIKSTAAFIEATDRLARRYPIDVEIVEGVPWMENLRRKAAADIVFDEVKLGYGLNSAEAWAMKMPALVGLVDPGARQMFMDAYGGFPYPDTTEETIEERLEELIVSPEARAHWGEVGHKFVNDIHSPQVVVPQAVDLFERLLLAKEDRLRLALS
jgi:hypothetical protein